MRHDAEIRELLHKRRDGHTLPQPFYTDNDLFEFDLRAVFHRLWIFAGLEAELRQPGDWLTLDIAATSVVVLRDRDGSVRAFLNICRHRGSRICSGESGQATRLICPYHQLIENNQRGVNSFGCEPGPYSARAEWTVAEFADWYCAEAYRYLSGSDGGLSAVAQ